MTQEEPRYKTADDIQGAISCVRKIIADDFQPHEKPIAVNMLNDIEYSLFVLANKQEQRRDSGLTKIGN